MAGHNKWSKIKHKKGAVDAKRGKVWTKIIREITVATRMGGEDLSGNPRLRKAIEDAKAANMLKENMLRAIAKGAGTSEGEDYEEITYEGFGPGACGILIKCMTDNRNRTFGDVRVTLNKRGGKLGAAGSVAFGFQSKGQIVFEKNPEQGDAPTEDALIEIGLDFGADEVLDQEEHLVVMCAQSDFFTLHEAYKRSPFNEVSAELSMVANTKMSLSKEHEEKLENLLEALEDLDDVQDVWTNVA